MDTLTTLTTDQKKISYNYYRKGHDNLILIAHGFFNSKNSILLSQLASDLSEHYDVVALDFRGHGESSGLYYWSAKEVDDLLSVLHQVNGDCKYQKVGVVGFSMGGTVSLLAAAKDKTIDSLVAVSPVSEFRKVDYHFWELDIENDILFGLLGKGARGKGVRPGPFWKKKIKPIDIVDSLDIPVLYIHGKNDWLIKPYHSWNLFKKTQSKKRLALIEKGPHAEYLLRKNREETQRLIQEWFDETLKGDNQ